MAGILHSGLYSGMIVATAEGAAPPGWLPCDGSLKLQSDYPDLYAAIQSTYNSGTVPSGYFMLPLLSSGYTPRAASASTVAGTRFTATTHQHTFNTSVNGVTLTSDGAHSHSTTATVAIITGGGHTHSMNVGGFTNSTSNMANAKAANGTLGTSQDGHSHSNFNTAFTPGVGGSHNHSGDISRISGNTGSGHSHNTSSVNNQSITVSGTDAIVSPHHSVFYIIKT